MMKWHTIDLNYLFIWKSAFQDLFGLFVSFFKIATLHHCTQCLFKNMAVT